MRIRTYRKRQKLSERKASRFTGFHSNVGKTFAGSVSSVLKALRKAITQKIHRENLCGLSNSMKTGETHLSLNFCR